MQAKGIITIIVVLVAIAIAYFLLAPKMVSSPATTETPAASAPSTKLNINAICQGALAYMAFPSSVEADAFVQECKDGKHPEVIEKWKRDNGITDDRAI